MEAWEEERVNVLRLLGTKNNTADKHVMFLVAVVRSAIKKNLNIYPDIGSFIIVQLCTIKRKHKDGAVVGYVSLRYSLQVVEAADIVVELRDLPIVLMKFIDDLLGTSFAIAHRLRSLS